MSLGLEGRGTAWVDDVELVAVGLDVPLTESVEDLRFKGVKQKELAALCDMLDANDVVVRFSN